MSKSSPEPGKRSMAARWLTLNVLLLALVGLLSLTYPVDELGRRLSDAYFRLRSRPATSESVALVLIDDTSLEKIGRWPWPRTELARLVRAVSQQQPAAIGLDILLPEPSDAASDRELAGAIQAAGNVVLAAKLGSGTDKLWMDPLPLFRAHAAGLGHVQAVVDTDGLARRVPLIELGADGSRWALAVQMTQVATGKPIHVDNRGLWIGDRLVYVEGSEPAASAETQRWAVVSRQFLIVDYRKQFTPGQAGPPFPVVSAAALLSGGKSTPELRGKLVLIGFGASDLSDRIATPVSGPLPMPGVEVHANVLQGLLTGRGIHSARFRVQLAGLLAFSLISTWVVLRWPGWSVAWIPLALWLACYLAGLWMFTHRGMRFDFGPLFFAAIFAVPLAQLENLALVNRSLNRGLQQLRGTLVAPTEFKTFQPDRSAQDDATDLQQKLDLIQSLQSELASSYMFRQKLLESMHEALAVFDGGGKNQFRNPYWERFCERQGWSPVIELADLGRRVGHPAWTDLADRMREGNLPPESEVFLGGGFWQMRLLRLNFDPQTGPQWMVVVTDLTSRLERDRARAEALRFVTHELRTPLVSIQGFAEYLLRYRQAAGSEEAAATIFRESQRLVSLINTYLDVLRFDAGARALRRERIVVAEMVAQVERVMAPIADASEIRIQIGLSPDLPILDGDSPMLTGVLLNLLNNAVKYSPSRSEVSLQVRREDTCVVFEVCNPGAPIPPERLSRLFEPFYRAPEQEPTTPGWGLGLTFVKRIVEEHKGTIEATSDENGIRVRVRIPVAGYEGGPRAETAHGSR